MNKTRFLALDVFRGLTIALMILVNTPGDWGHVYSPLLHVPWNGISLADVVFPFFLFIVGASVFFAFNRQGLVLTSESFLKVVKRSIIMFAIGFGLNVYNTVLLDLDSVRIMGVLQRIAICYCIGSLLILSCRIRTLYLVSILLLIAYYVIFIVVGGEHPFVFEDNIVGRFDQLILGEAHMWKMNGVAFDPEGLLSTIPAVVSLLFGFETARRLHLLPSAKGAKLLVIVGVSLVLIAYLLSFIMQINKNIWSVSYVVLTAGLAMLLLFACVCLLGIKQATFLSRPLQIYGTNPLFVYCLSWLMATAFMAIPVEVNGSVTSLYTALWQFLLPLFAPNSASLVFALLHVVFFWYISFILYRKNIIVRI